MIVVTGGASFTGSNIAKAPNGEGVADILAADNLKDGTKFASLVDLDIADYMDKEGFLIQIMTDGEFDDVKTIFHEDVYSSITEWDGKYMTNSSYQYSRELLHYCLEREISFLYTSSAATYDERISDFIEPCEYEEPLNAYGYSKFLFDEHVHQILPETNSQIAGFCHPNVYGSRRGRKGNMASVALHLNTQLNNGESPKLFKGSGNFRRNFIHVGNAADVSLWFLGNGVSGILNLGTGHAESFQAVADVTLTYRKKSQIEYIPFPGELKDRYQAFTQTDLTNLRAAGYGELFKTVVESVMEYTA